MRLQPRLERILPIELADITRDRGRKHEATADRERQDVVSVSLQVTYQLSGFQIPDVNLATGAGRIKECAIQGNRMNGVTFFASIVKSEKFFWCPFLRFRKLPELDHAVAAARDENFITSTFRHTILDKKHAVDVSVVREVPYILLPDLQQLAALRMSRRDIRLSRPWCPNTAWSRRVKERIISQTRMDIPPWTLLCTLLSLIAPLNTGILSAQVDRLQGGGVYDAEDIADVVGREEAAFPTPVASAPDVDYPVACAGEEQAFIPGET